MAGRGRGRGALKLSALLRPGSTPDGNANNSTDAKDASRELEKIISELQGLSFEVRDEQLKSIHKLIQDYSVTVERLDDICESFYKRCQQDHKIASALACVADDLSNIEVNGKKFRAALFQLVQIDYKSKEDLFNNSPTKFVAIVSFLCQLFSVMRINNQPLTFLVVPVYDYLHMLVSAESTETMVEAFSLQIVSVGAILEKSNSDKMQDLMKKVRSRILSSKSTEKSRCLLLEALELHSNQWKPLSPDLSGFFGEALANSSSS